jgi:hypothetical protein
MMTAPEQGEPEPREPEEHPVRFGSGCVGGGPPVNPANLSEPWAGFVSILYPWWTPSEDEEP